MPLLRLIATLLCLVGVVAWRPMSLNGACQNQECKFSIDCYRCEDLNGTGCTVNSCDDCKETRCTLAPAPMSVPILTDSGMRLGLSRVALQACGLPANVIQASLSLPVASARDGLTAPETGVALNFLRQDSAPASIIEMSFGRPDAFRSAVIKNLSTKHIEGITLGWVEISSDGTKPSIGATVRLNAPAAPGDEYLIQDSLTTVNVHRSNATRLMFFVAGVEFTDGTAWRQNLAALRNPSGINTH